MNYRKPSLNLLAPLQEKGKEIQFSEVKKRLDALARFLEEFGLPANIENAYSTPFSIVYQIRPKQGFTLRKLKDGQKDLEVRMGNEVTLYQDENDMELIDIVVLSKERSRVGLRNIIQDDAFQKSTSPLTIAAGVDTLGQFVYLDLAENPHLLIEGVTGSGKTIFLDDILMSLIYKASPEQVRFMLIDPKGVDLLPYEGIQHLMRPVITNMDIAFDELVRVEEDMRYRYKLLAQEGVRDIEAYNRVAQQKLPHFVLILDEYKDMIENTEKALAETIDHIASRGRSVGVHLVIATQTASSEIIPMSTKANISLRIAFANVSTVKGPDGKVRLLGSGDMLILPNNGVGVTRAQASYVSFEEIKKVVSSVTHRNEKLDYILHDEE